MRIKIVFKAIKVSLLLLFIVFAFGIGLSLDGCLFGGVSVHSETSIRNDIGKHLDIEVSEHASDLYYAWISGEDDTRCYAALTLTDKEECQAFLAEQLKIPFEGFTQKTTLPESFFDGGPATWQKTGRGDWEVLGHKESYIYDNDDMRLKILFVPEHYRIFVYKTIPNSQFYNSNVFAILRGK